jgi:hypothetical protein
MTHYDRSLISERKRAANIANAQKSTGPRTPEGKARSSRNALKHGRYASPITAVAPATRTERDVYQRLMADFVDRFQPRDPIEQMLLERLALAYLRTLRASYAESGAAHSLFKSADLGFADTIPNTFRAILDYDAAAERSVLRTLRELRLHRRDAQNEAKSEPTTVQTKASSDHTSTYSPGYCTLTPDIPLDPRTEALLDQFFPESNPPRGPIPSPARGSWNGKPPLSSLPGDFNP